MTPAEIWKRIDVRIDTGCWEWAGRMSDKGYGRTACGTRTEYAHRVVYEMERGAIPDRLQLDHLCRNTICVNPLHLEPVTRMVNILRGVGCTARQARQTHCYRGHPLSGDNLKTYGAGRNRYCVICQQARDRARRPKRYAALKERANG